MEINIKVKPAGTYCVEADGKVIEPDARYADLPVIIDRIYEGRETETAVMLVEMADKLGALACSMKREAALIEVQCEYMLETYRRIMETANE